MNSAAQAAKIVKLRSYLADAEVTLGSAKLRWMKAGSNASAEHVVKKAMAHLQQCMEAQRRAKNDLLTAEGFEVKERIAGSGRQKWYQ